MLLLTSFSYDIVDVTGIAKVELKITYKDGNESKYSSLKSVLDESEEMLVHGAHASVDKAWLGSLVILLHPESCHMVTKLKQFIENGQMSLFLAQLLKTAHIQGLLEEDEHRLEIQMKVETTGRAWVNKVFWETVTRWIFVNKRNISLEKY